MDAENATLGPEALLDLQRTVQRKLGRCLLRLQQYELLLKALVAHSDIAGPPDQLQAVRDEKIACAQKKTLGTLVGMLTEGCLTTSEADESADHEANTSGGFWFRTRFQMELDPDQYETTKSDLKELVDLRNELVHHFLERFNFWEADGCAAADAFLDESFETIDGHFLTLREWVNGMENSRAMLASFMETPTFKDLFFDGIHPDGSVDWPSCGIVGHLREAETVLAQAGWTELNAAIGRIRQRAPSQTPKRYGCGSWRHVIHESRQFEIRKQTTQAGTVVSYRSHPEGSSMPHVQAS
ncbi:MAG: hypothetical protein H6R16_2999 [Proteobacteria bacterium]|nr:hypothetical protein [Pseudomonadota bacterium]